MEIWKNVKGFEGQYEVSNLGRIKSMNYRGTGKSGILKVATNKSGYGHLSLYPGGVKKNFSVHVLVMSAFVGERPDGFDIAHLNGIANDNRLENLVYVTPKVNNSHKELHGTTVTGERNGKSKLTDDVVREIRRDTTKTCSDFAEMYGLARTTIYYARVGVTWRCVT